MPVFAAEAWDGPPVAFASVRFAYGAASNVGLRRRENQDRFLADGSVFAVADGLGGHAGGATAAGIAVSVLARCGPFRTLDELVAAVGSANIEIMRAARDDPRLHEMSTTICAAADLGAAPERRLAAVNVGDSRLYVLVAGALHRLTTDHTVVQNLVRDGVLTESAAASYPDRHTLTRAVGFDPVVAVDGWVMRATGGLRLLVCSDGLTNEVPDHDIADLLRAIDNPVSAARSLVAAAMRPGRGRDNVTAVVVDVVGPTHPQADGLDALLLESHPAMTVRG